MNQADQGRVVFSTLYNESDGFLATYVENFLRHTGPDALLVVNLPPGRSIACPVAANSDRVLVITGALARRKFGHTLLNGHLESFDAALHRFGRFDHFCSLASNSLFARRFDPVAARAALARSGHVADVDLHDLPNHWHWPMLTKSPGLIRFMTETWGLSRVVGSQIEGLFATAADWGLLHTRREEIIAFGAIMGPDGDFPMEEILPATMICTFGSGRYVHLCHMFWDRPFIDNVQLDDVLAIGERFPAHVCLLKWFERSPTNLITAAAATGMAGDLTARLAAVPESQRNQRRVLYRLIFAEMARALRSQERFSSLISTWRPAADGQPPKRHFGFNPTLDGNRQIIGLPVGPDTPSGQALAYLFTEQTGVPLRLQLDVTDDEQTVVTLSSQPADFPAGTGAPDETALQGFLYLACCLEPGDRIFRLRVLSDRSDRLVHVEERIVLNRAGRYFEQAPTPVVEHDGVREFHYPCEGVPDADDVWIGLPFFGRSDYRVAIDVV